MVRSPGWFDDLDALDSGALFSPCRRFRYLLWRRWDRELPVCAFICLNPSTADETKDDPTVRRCIRFASDWGFGSLWVLNAYAFRATDPREMRAAGIDALGPRNNEYLRVAAVNADRVVAAWGTHCDDIREATVKLIVTNTGTTLYCLGLTAAGRPRHPLYLRADTPLQAWASPEGL